jgi:hypothetical protein
LEDRYSAEELQAPATFGDLRRGLEQVADVIGGEIGISERALRDRIDDLAQRLDEIEARVGEIEARLDTELN